MAAKIIHLIFLNKDEVLPEIFTKCVKRIHDYHPDWQINTYGEDEASQIIHVNCPELFDWYNSYTHTVQKADILRVLLVYLFGGFYLDMDMYLYNNLDALLPYDLVLGEEKTLSQEDLKLYGDKHALRVANYMFGGNAGHLFWLYYLHEAILRSSNVVVGENDILETTGPGLMTDVYHATKKTFPNTVFLTNDDRYCESQQHHEISCHFGKYAAHFHCGTWRSNKKPQNYDSVYSGCANESIENARRHIAYLFSKAVEARS
ncbi:glycosyltransferase [Pedobacter sp. JY14-1]|uniref:glycosyltransferase family 32 protein n=1 Tax=Pedobacter sp. JY14-1 TaxID=3034151 RepID=UPI0023E314EA|nr:glycosyltransferase [Pedobacter sp. JY14-1]